jgi:hypothetical protein
MLGRIKSASPKAAAVVGVVALVVTVGGGTAVAKSLISGSDIKNGSVTSIDIKNKSLQVGDLSSSAAASLKGRTGAQGTAGIAGAMGAAGAAGVAGVAGVAGAQGPAGLVGLNTLVHTTTWTPDNAGDPALTATVSCPTGQVALGGGFTSEGDAVHSPSSISGTFITSSHATPTGWLVEGFNSQGNLDVTVVASVVCAQIAP